MDLYPTVTIVENFYENPDLIREFALKQKFSYCHELKNIDYVYPGCRTKELFDLDKNLCEKVCKKLVSIFHNTQYDHMRWAISTSFQVVEAKFERGVLHQDTNTIFAGVIYLTPDAPIASGTSLFKPNKSFNEEKYQTALKQNDINFKTNRPVSTEYHSMFDETVRVNNVYNTLIIFNAQTYHAANDFFGDSLKNGRMAQVFFINKIDAKSYDIFPLQRTKAINI
jgi:hypothetical protein